MGIVKYQRVKTAEENREEYIAAMWLLYLRVPGRETLDASGVLDLGEIGEERASRGVVRDTPYSIGTGLKDLR
jgi:hypothetical protein